MNDLEKFNETSLPGKEEFYSNLNIEDIMDLDYHYAKRICKDFEFGWVSWFVSWKWYIIISWWFWKLMVLKFMN